jgi:putative ABC transport system permease protein
MLRLFRKLSLPQLVENGGRTILVIGGVAVGVALIIAINIINESVLASFRRSIEVIAGPSDLQVTLGVGEVGFSSDVLSTIRSDVDVAAAVPLVRGTVALAEEPTTTLQIFGVDLLAEEDLERYRVTLATERRFADEAVTDLSSIFVTRVFADTRGLELHDELAFATPSGVRTLTIRGLLETEGFALAYGGQLAVMDIFAAQTLLNRTEHVDQIDIVLKDGADAAAVQVRLDNALPDMLTVQLPEHHGVRYDRVLSSFQAMLTGLSSLCLVAGLFIIYNTTSTAALRRADTVASLRLIGADPLQLFRTLLGEALILGVTGGLLGIALGIPLAWILSGTITSSMGVIFQLRFPIDSLAIRPFDLGTAVVLGVAVSIFASSFAARRMAALDPLTAMRGGAEAVVTAHTSRRFIYWWLALVAASAVCFAMEDEYKSIAWGNVGSTIWNASVVVVAIPLMQWLSTVLARVLPRWFGAEGQVAAGSLARAETRSGVTVAAVALIVTVATLLSSLVLSCRESLASYFAGFLASDLTVSAVSTEGGWLETPLSLEVEKLLAAVPGVTTVSTARVLAGQPYREDRIAILGLSPPLFDPLRAPAGWYQEGDASDAEPALSSGRAATVSASFSDRFDLHLGDTVELASPTGTVKLPIVGVVPDYVSDRGSVIMSRDVLADRWGETSANRFLVTISPGATGTEVRDHIETSLGSRFKLKILTTRELLDYHTDQIDRAFAVMNSVQLLIVIVTVAGIFDLLVSRIVERRRELAVWQVIGASEASIRKSVIIESATIGGVGALLGIGVGVVTSWLWVTIHFRELLGYYVDFHFATGAMLWYVALVVVMTIVAGYAAAGQAMRNSVLHGIRHE